MAYKEPTLWALIKDLKHLIDDRDQINRQIDEIKSKIEREMERAQVKAKPVKGKE